MITEFGVSLKKARRELGMSSAVAARRIGVHASSIFNWENGHTEPQLMYHAAIQSIIDEAAIRQPQQAHCEAVVAVPVPAPVVEAAPAVEPAPAPVVETVQPFSTVLSTVTTLTQLIHDELHRLQPDVRKKALSAVLTLLELEEGGEQE